MQISARGIQLIKQHEGLRLEAYVCPAGKWTIGYGHTATARQGQRITQAQAEELLRLDLQGAESVVNKAGLQLAQHQFDALVSLVYNIGGGAFLNSTLLRRLRDGAPMPIIRDQWRRWVMAGGRRLQGLINRREEELAMYEGR
jgi:lysozyme